MIRICLYKRGTEIAGVWGRTGDLHASSSTDEGGQPLITSGCKMVGWNAGFGVEHLICTPHQLRGKAGNRLSGRVERWWAQVYGLGSNR